MSQDDLPSQGSNREKPVRFIHAHMPDGVLLGGSGSAVEGAEEAEGEA